MYSLEVKSDWKETVQYKHKFELTIALHVFFHVCSKLGICYLIHQSFSHIYISIHPSIYLSIYLYLSIFIYLSLSINLSICLSIHLSIYLSVTLFISLTIRYISFYFQLFFKSIYLSNSPSIVSLFIYLSICSSIYL